MNNRDHIVAITQCEPRYSPKGPYDPPQRYPELKFGSGVDRSNHVYTSVRRLFQLLRYDHGREGSPTWNPLSWLIQPGETVFIKPNMIAHKHEFSDEWEHVITHGSVIRAVVDYAYLALEGKGKIIIGDGCQGNSDFDRIIQRMGLPELREYYRREVGFEIDIVDLRDYRWLERDGVFVKKEDLPGDPLGKVNVDLASLSMFSQLDGKGKRYYGATYDVDETNVHHSNGTHEYAFSRSPLAADVFINLPKLKTHKKCGLTVNLKSLVGLNANKNWLPHYAFGSPEQGGDQFDRDRAAARLENSLVLKAKNYLLHGNPALAKPARIGKKWAYKVFGSTDKVVRSGNWHGNDTVWRMSLDLNRILMYCSPEGKMTSTRKKFFSLVDGIVAMEGNGPVAGTRKEIGVLIAGINPVAVDLTCGRLMGFDYRRLPILGRAMETHPYMLFDGNAEDIECTSDKEGWNMKLSRWTQKALIPFKPHFGWVGHVELTN